MGTACSKVPSHTSEHLQGGVQATAHALLDSPVRTFVPEPPLCALPLAPALIPGASENVPGTTPQGNGGPSPLHPPNPTPSASLPQAYSSSGARTDYFWGGRKASPRGTSVPLQLCSLSL